MRLLIAATIALLCTTAAFARTKAGQKAGVEFSEMVYDFGNVSEDAAPIVHEFTYTNTGDGPVAVLWAKASCGCTSPAYDRKPLKPGAKGTIKVKFIPIGQRGEVDKNVRVRFKNSAGRSEEVTLRLVGTVTPKVRKK